MLYLVFLIVLVSEACYWGSSSVLASGGGWGRALKAADITPQAESSWSGLTPRNLHWIFYTILPPGSQSKQGGMPLRQRLNF